MRLPDSELSPEVTRVVRPAGRAITDLPDLMARLARLEQLGEEVTVYPDAEAFIEERCSATGSRAP